MSIIRLAIPADAPEIARVHIASWQTAYRGILSDPFLDGLMDTYPQRLAMWQARLPAPEPPDARTFVAEVPGAGIVGFSSASSARERIVGFAGEVQAIYLLAERRRAGLGRVLFARAVAYLRELSHDSLQVWVLDTNAAACRFYEAMGGSVIAGARKERLLGGVAVAEIAYGWRSLGILRDAP